MMFMENGEPEMAFSRGGLLMSPSSQRPSSLPALTSSQAEALDMVHLAATRTATNVSFIKGDMLFFNNRKILHGRKQFFDGEGEAESRHFLRLWLRDEKLAGHPPGYLRGRWAKIFDYNRNEDDSDERWPLEPISVLGEAISTRLQ